MVRGSPPSPGIAAPAAQRAPGTRSLLRHSASSGAGLWVPRASPALARAGQGRRGFTSAAQQPPAGRGRRGRPGSSLPHGRCLSGSPGSPGGVGAGSVSGRSARGSGGGGGGSGRSLPRGGSAGLRPGRAPHVPAAPGGCFSVGSMLRGAGRTSRSTAFGSRRRVPGAQPPLPPLRSASFSVCFFCRLPRPPPPRRPPQPVPRWSPRGRCPARAARTERPHQMTTSWRGPRSASGAVAAAPPARPRHRLRLRPPPRRHLWCGQGLPGRGGHPGAGRAPPAAPPPS